MTPLQQLKLFFRTRIKVVPGGPPVGTAGSNRAAGVLDALDALADLAAASGLPPDTTLVNADDVPTAKALAIIAANAPAVPEPDTSYDGKSFFDDRDPNAIIFYWCRKSRAAAAGGAQGLSWFRFTL